MRVKAQVGTAFNAAVRGLIKSKLELDEEFKKLSMREKECLLLLVTGYLPKEIANVFCRSPRTIEQHIQNIKIKLCVDSKTDLIKKIFH